jgi:hypothetical protein
VTRLLQPTLLRRVDGTLVAECTPCRLCLELLPGADTELAVAAFRETHPAGARHRPVAPAGWRSALSWPGALSQ